MLKRGRPAQIIEVKPEITTQVYDKGDGIKQIWTWNKMIMTEDYLIGDFTFHQYLKLRVSANTI